MSRQDNSDPLPYVQVDRAVKPKATLLANALGVSTQHALGSLVEWWELCGDPRELETIVAATPAGTEPAVILEATDASLRFKLASGKEVEPVVLVRLQLLEPKPDGRFRVRGMSRYFEPIERRMRAREIAAMGGKASAESRRKSTGSAQPTGGRGSTDAQPQTEQRPNRQPNNDRTDDRTRTEPTTEAQPNTAVSGQRSSSKEEPETLARSVPQLELVSEKPKTRPPRPPDPEAEFQRFANSLTPDEASVFEAYETHMGVRLGADWGLRKFVGQKLKSHHATELCAAIRGHASDAWRREHSPSLRAILRDASVIASLAKAGAA